MEKVVKTFVSEIRSINEKDFTLEAVISDETIDRYGEVIKVSSWKKRLDRYKSQPVLLSSHRYDKLTNQIGKAEDIKIKDGKLIAKFKYFIGEGNEEADWGWKLASKFGTAAYSVGFLPYKYEDAEYDEEVKAGNKPYRTYTDVELLEVSQVLVPANPSALMKSFNDEDGELKDYIQMVQKGLEDSKDFEDIIKEDLNVIEEKDVGDGIVTKPDTENYIHIGVPEEEGKHTGHKIRTITLDKEKGIKAHYCVDCKKITGYLFDKDKGWTHEKAQEWVDKHSKNLEESHFYEKWFELKIFSEWGDKVEKIFAELDDIDEFIKSYNEWFTTSKQKEEDMQKFLDAISGLSDKIEELNKKLTTISELLDTQFEVIIDDDGFEDKHIEEENYIKELLEETNKLLEKFPVQQ